MKPLLTSPRSIGLAVPLLSLRTRKGPCGEFPDIVDLADLAKRWNLDLIQILPVNDTGSQTSPYSALSAFALNPIYLRLGDLPEVTCGAAPASTSASITALSAEFSADSRVEYGSILSRKL
jgi:4-alpha-glucanotransferase